MALETSTYISGLVASNPTSTDPKAQGDDHLRLIKSTILATWPNITGAVTATHTELNYVVGVTSAIQTQINTKYTAGSTTQALGTPISGNLVNCTGATVALSGVTAATTTSTLANANNAIAWNWTLTGASTVGQTISETSASTGGAGSQVLCKIGTLAASTADPLQVQTRGADTIRVSRTGDVTVTAGTVAAAAAPIITLQGGVSNAAQSGNSGGIVLTAGAAGSGGIVGGPIVITSGAGNGSGKGGALTLAAGAGGSAGIGGDVSVSAGAANTTAANGGNITLTSGAPGSNAASVPGSITISTPATSNNTGGNISITAGNATTTGGSINITVGTGSTRGYMNFTNSNVANGAVATTVTSLGPTGSATTIQGWLAIKVAGTARFIPFW